MTLTNDQAWTTDPALAPWLAPPADPATGDDLADDAAPPATPEAFPAPGQLTPQRTLSTITTEQHKTAAAGAPTPADGDTPQARVPSPYPRATSAAPPQPTQDVALNVSDWAEEAMWGSPESQVAEPHAQPANPAPTVPAYPAAQSCSAPGLGMPVWGHQRGPVAPQAPSLEVVDLVRVRSERPTQGWRRVAYRSTGGRWNPGLSEQEAERRRLIGKARTQCAGSHRITVASLKGGVGKTTMVAGLGLTLAEYRGDRIVALDANPDAGTLADRLTGHCGVTVRELINNMHSVRSWTDMAHYTSLAGRLQVLASEQDPAMSEAFNREEYTAVQRLLASFYNVIITDSGTGLVHSAMGGALDSADTLVIAAAPTLDGASRAAKTLDWLAAHGYGPLVERAVVALSCDRVSPDVDSEAIVAYFQGRCHTVVEIPGDPHLAIGGMIELDALRDHTRDGFLRLAAAVAEQFSWGLPAAGGRR